MAQAQRTGIEIVDITKRFGSVTANDQVCLAVKRGEILALLGENGSGKTTLMNMLSGIYYPDSGQIYVDGREVTIRSPKDAFAEGIGMIHQHFKLVDVLSAAENIVLGMAGAGRLNRKKLGQEIRGIGERYGFHVDPDKKIYRMSVSEKQTVEILKVLYRGADILILDEPTAVLTPQETDRLFDILRAMRDDGKAIIIITHKLNEVLAVSDRVSVLRRGQSIGTIETKQADAKTLTAMMVGHEVKMEILRLPPKEQTLCTVNDLTVRHSDGYLALDGVSFELKQGEILGVAGVAGSGQKELCEALAGLLETERGGIEVGGVPISGLSPSAQQKAGVRIGFIPEDRLGMGLVASLNIAENLLVRGYRGQKGFTLRRKPAIKQAEQMIDFLEINTKGPMQRVSELSGGNVQKVLLWRELTESPPMIITAYPTRGLDISSSYMVYDMLTGQKAKGAGVLFVGEDLDVLLELCDRILVLCGGRVSGVVDARTATKEEIGWMMTDTGRAQS
ncbi:MAG: ABC transporter ATP-binding protein [Oscillospiraceae bacterium]|nr:ABC transporter ATP-binding protein [Oscillospiraceae bacterium]